MRRQFLRSQPAEQRRTFCRPPENTPHSLARLINPPAKQGWAAAPRSMQPSSCHAPCAGHGPGRHSEQGQRRRAVTPACQPRPRRPRPCAAPARPPRPRSRRHRLGARSPRMTLCAWVPAASHHYSCTWGLGHPGKPVNVVHPIHGISTRKWNLISRDVLRCAVDSGP